MHSIFHIGAFINNIADFKAKLNGVSADFNTDFGRYLGVGGSARIPVGSKISPGPFVFIENEYDPLSIRRIFSSDSG